MSNKVKGICSLDPLAPHVINVGHGNYVVASQVVAILESGSLPVRRQRDNALKANLLVDATAGRKTRSVIVTCSNHVVLSTLAPETIQDRLQTTIGAASAARLEVEEGEFVS